MVTISLLLSKLDKIANTLTTSKKRTFEKQFNKHKLKWIYGGMRKRDCNFRTAKTVSLKLYSLWQNLSVLRKRAQGVAKILTRIENKKFMSEIKYLNKSWEWEIEHRIPNLPGKFTLYLFRYTSHQVCKLTINIVG